jgi:prepilin-type processing-associated H-X9-DG protein
MTNQECGAKNDGTAALPPARCEAGYAARLLSSPTGRIGLLVVVVVLVGALAAVLVLVVARDRARAASCRANARSISVALLRYAADNDDTLPLAANWCDAVLPYIGHAAVFRCPASGTTRGSAPASDYWLNAGIAGARVGEIHQPDATVSIFEGSRGWNASGGQSDVRTPHGGTCTHAYADGHVRPYDPTEPSADAWAPGASQPTAPPDQGQSGAAGQTGDAR